MTRRRRVGALAALVGAGLAIAGCGPPGATPGGLSLTISENFGAKVLQSLARSSYSGRDNVMQLITHNLQIVPRADGREVQAIDGIAQTPGKEWLYYVNGVRASKGPTKTKVYPGDRIWWDLHDTLVTSVVPAVVGSFPEPFLYGTGGQQLPLRVECAPPGAAVCNTVINRLHAIGATPFPALLGGSEETQTLRVLVGTFSELKVDPAAASLATGPSASGVYARFTSGGSQLALLGSDGAVARTLGAGAGLVAATRFDGSAPIWLITGTDAAGVQAAAGLLDAGDLDDHFAVAVQGTTPLPIPLGTGS
ncbi:MAG TPA: DUF4430 domain-containing protein [Solirubrobacteraceae bacterium]|jgi:hypothetical protein|nr:DUF4430 domain-containing protein [Solirubrobacteraceae bacterium]